MYTVHRDLASGLAAGGADDLAWLQASFVVWAASAIGGASSPRPFRPDHVSLRRRLDL